MQLSKNIESYFPLASAGEDNDIMSDIRYICKSCSLITESLQKGCDVIQMPNGDIIVTEIKMCTFKYSWDKKKGKLVRAQSSGRSKKAKFDDDFDDQSMGEADADLMSDIRYICKSCSLITESLQKGSDVLQMPNGDIIITEAKAYNFQYSWDSDKGKLVRVQATSGRGKKSKSDDLFSDEDQYESEEADQMM